MYRSSAAAVVSWNGTNRFLRNFVPRMRRPSAVMSFIRRLKASETRNPVAASRPNNVLYVWGTSVLRRRCRDAISISRAISSAEKMKGIWRRRRCFPKTPSGGIS